MISPAASTVTVSSTPPSSSVARTDAGVAALTTTSFRTTDLNPARVIATQYVPGWIAGIENVPCSEVTALNVALVARFLTTTTAPGTAAPDVSTTFPDSEDDVPPWA